MTTDLEKARSIVARREVYVSTAGTMHENIAEAVAQGIALGRREGLEIAAKAISGAISKLPPSGASDA